MGLKTPLISKVNFNEKVLDPTKDVLLLVFTSQYPEDSKKNYNHKFADVFINIKKKFADVGIATVKFLAVDINVEQGLIELGKWNEIDESPMFLIFPAHHKQLVNSKKFYGKLLARDFAKFIHRNADLKF